MSGIAEIMKNLGYKVTGSDQQKNSNVLRLKKLGVKIFIGHNSNNVENASLVVFSSAISKNNSENVSCSHLSKDLCIQFLCLLV